MVHSETPWDVVICGAGLSGLTLGLQLQQDVPGLKIALVDKLARPLPDAAHKIGESSVELGSQYLERLGLYEYLRDNHIVKFGLRFFPGGGTRPVHERLEIGPDHEPVVRSWQLDRGIFENDLRQMLVDDGVTLLEGSTVKDVELGSGDARHTVTVQTPDGTETLNTRWLVDATGRAALLRKRLKSKRGAGYVAHAGWFRVKGRVDITDFVPEDADTDWRRRPMADQRWRSTNHLMGDGYWAWIIPLSSGNTSIGIVVHDDFHGFDSIRTLDACKDFLAKHEVALADGLEGFEVMDFGCYKSFSHITPRSWSPDRWAMVGEAGSFTDPLYSPGTDLIAFANSFTATLIKEDFASLDGGPPVNLRLRSRDLNLMYRALISGGLKVYRNNGAIYGHPRAMSAKIYYDNFIYWSFPCQYFQQRLYELPSAEHTKFAWAGGRFVELSEYCQDVLRQWATLSPEEPEGKFAGIPAYPSILIDLHVALQDKRTPSQALAAMMAGVKHGEELLSELALRVIQELGPDKGAQMVAEAKLASWGIQWSPARLALEAIEDADARWEQLPELAQDVERALGPVKRHRQAAQARELLLHLEQAGKAA